VRQARFTSEFVSLSGSFEKYVNVSEISSNFFYILYFVAVFTFMSNLVFFFGVLCSIDIFAKNEYFIFKLKSLFIQQKIYIKQLDDDDFIEENFKKERVRLSFHLYFVVCSIWIFM
jgi:hypothetical protein